MRIHFCAEDRRLWAFTRWNASTPEQAIALIGVYTSLLENNDTGQRLVVSFGRVDDGDIRVSTQVSLGVYSVSTDGEVQWIG